MSYPIVHLTTDSALGKEAMGTKTKEWCKHPTDTRNWLFKEPRTGTGEHWAEKITAELGALLGIPCAQVELATFDSVRGTITRNILAGGNEAMVHGNELLAGYVIGYDANRVRGQQSHTWANICAAISARCGEERCKELLGIFAGYLVFDAWIGNTDRHHQNWALIQRRAANNVVYEMCPSFDHASSLGRELIDSKREAHLHDGLNKYRQHPKARGAIYWQEIDSQPLGCIELVRRAYEQMPEHFEPWLQRLKIIGAEPLQVALNNMDHNWISQPAKDFAFALLKANQEEMRLIHG